MTTQDAGTAIDIEQIPLFADLTLEEHRRITEIAVYRTCPGGTLIVDVGEPAKEMYVIVSGQVMVLPSADWTGTPVAHLGPGEFFGEMALVNDEARTATVKAKTSTVVATFSQLEFARLIQQYPGMAAKVDAVVAARRAGTVDNAFLSGAYTLRTIPLSKSTISLGRGRDNDIVLADRSVSPYHADIEGRDGRTVLRDAHSASGTYKNGAPISEADIEDGDEIWLGSTKLFIVGDAIKWVASQPGMRVEVTEVARTVGDGREILKDIDLVVSPGELVAIVGPSGAGKTTLLNAILGLEPPSRGAVYFDGQPLSGLSDVFRTSLGYVPQDDIVHPELSVEESLLFAAKLRTPPDTTLAEMKARVDEVIVELGLERERENLVGNLSGGQRKRVSIGVELIGDPRVFFLDEPTSGLDPRTDAQLMELLRELANSGRTVMLTTHATQNVDVCDRIVVLSGGRLAFTGSPKEALQYFDATRFVDVYGRLAEKTPELVADEFKVSESYVRNVHARLIVDLDDEEQPDTVPTLQSAARSAGAKHRGFVRQFMPLLDRTLKTTLRDRVNMILRVLGPPVLGASMLLTFDAAIFEVQETDGGNYISVITLLYLAAAISLFLGAFTAGNAITSERAIFRRERLSGLSPAAYVLAKFGVLGAFAVLQAVLLVATIALGIDLPDTKSLVFITAAVALTSLAGTTMGMLVSSLSPNADRAAILIVLLLIPQLIFAGSTVPRSEMREPSKIVSDITVSKWSLELSGLITDLETREFKQAFVDLSPYPGSAVMTIAIPDEMRPFDHSFKGEQWIRWTMLSAFSVLFLGATLAVQSLKGRPLPPALLRFRG
jgi:ABC transport system ATP-binding/permease protein